MPTTFIVNQPFISEWLLFFPRWTHIYIYIYTIWLFNIAMEKTPFFKCKPSINGPFPLAMLVITRGYIYIYILHIDISIAYPRYIPMKHLHSCGSIPIGALSWGSARGSQWRDFLEDVASGFCFSHRGVNGGFSVGIWVI